MIVAIIPARGGSKRIPRKNIRDFMGLPMIAYSIRAALESGLFDKIIVSTDSQEIAEIAKAHGAEVPFLRPANLADDHASTAAVLVHALEFCSQQGWCPEYACCIYATAPFIQPEYLVQGLEVVRNSSADNSFSVSSYAFPVFRAQRIKEDGLLEMQWPEHRLTRSQDLTELYHDAGQFYWMEVAAFMANPNLYANAAPVVLPRHLVQDIDTEEDWHRAELMYKADHL